MGGRRYYLAHRNRILTHNRKSAAAFYERSGGLVRARTKATREAFREQIRRIKESMPCTDCGRTYPYYVTDFDHISDNKIVGVSQLVRLGATWEIVQEEIAKCELVCANCHRERTFQRGLKTARLASAEEQPDPRFPSLWDTSE